MLATRRTLLAVVFTTAAFAQAGWSADLERAEYEKAEREAGAAPAKEAAKDAPANKPVAKPPLMGQYPKFDSIAWSADSEWVFSTGDFNFLARWKAADGRMWVMVDMRHHASSFAASSKSGKLIIGTHDGLVELRDKWPLDLIREFKIAADYSTDAVALSADDRLFASCGSGWNQVRIWSIAEGKRIHLLGDTLQEPGGYGAMTFSPDATRVAAMSQFGRLHVWNLADETLVAPPIYVVGSQVRFTPDGKTVIAVDPGIVTFWNPGSDVPPKIVRAPESIAPMPPPPGKGAVQVSRITARGGALFAGATCLAPGDELVASATQDGSIAIWSIATREIVQTLPKSPVTGNTKMLNGEIRSLRYSPDGRRLAAATYLGEIIFWEVP